MISKFILDEFSDILTNSKICSGCRKERNWIELENADMSLDESNDCVKDEMEAH